jgi:phage baseplate assembly protein gpV
VVVVVSFVFVVERRTRGGRKWWLPSLKVASVVLVRGEANLAMVFWSFYFCLLSDCIAESFN